jgi:hypothetical protein
MILALPRGVEKLAAVAALMDGIPNSPISG